MRAALLLLVACGSGGSPSRDDAAVAPRRVVHPDAGVASTAYADLPAAIAAIVPADARVIGFGELHARTDRAQVKSALARFTDALPAFTGKASDLVVETWIVDPKCGKSAVEATQRVEESVKRPAATKSEIGQLADAAKAAKIRPHAMQMTCDDYKKVAPAGKDVDLIVMLGLVTRELGRLASEGASKSDKQILVYGGALHNDRFPEAGTEDWSYAAKVDAATHGHFVEVDLIVPEFASDDAASKRQPWFPLVAAADDKVHVYTRGERSFVVVLPRT